jgi:NAD(P)-dependent dehydrogenase (short-subunit alcohol dehydrogenase family)
MKFLLYCWASCLAKKLNLGLEEKVMRTYIITGVGKKNSLGNLIANAIKTRHRYFHQECRIIAITAPGQAAETSSCDQSFTCDLSGFANIKNLFTQLEKMNPEINCLINCAGMNKMDWFEDVDFSDFRDVMAVNCYAPIFITQYLFPSLARAKGTVFNVISMGAHKPFRTSLAYNVSKAGLLMATKQLARELIDKGITVFGVSPNELSGTGMTLENAKEICRIRGWTPDQVEKARGVEQTSPNALADFVAYLLTEDSNHKMMNGVDLYYGD